ncbi:hypothetical protein [Streptacidiphilus sp. ASG 303]|uniref:hypothetical protein n=1 Tax=Streptomycetaceae TaxID=2062 RepID=UPI001E3D61C9|nr:hypothetical protein [Streptacidiphilus sp. ASG 303]MCD0484198.1 hypothetical protein [Streptacidiphilus sp. ASG 303]
MDTTELQEQTAELLPRREALGRFNLNLLELTNINQRLADVDASNTSFAVNNFSDDALAQANSGQWINVR